MDVRRSAPRCGTRGEERVGKVVRGKAMPGRGMWRWSVVGGESRILCCVDFANRQSLARLGGNVVGVDASASNIAIATLHASHDPFLPFNQAGSSSSHIPGSLEYRHSPAEALRDAGEKFDVVCAMEVVEHVDSPGEFMKCLGDMVKPGGHLVMSTISRTPLAQLLTLTLAEDVLRLVTPGTHTYRKFIKPEELRRFVYSDMGGFETWEGNNDRSDIRTDEVGETRGIVYDPLKGEWRLWAGAEVTWRKSAGEQCNYMFHARKRL